jgi:polyhydroxyalkanoate synthase
MSDNSNPSAEQAAAFQKIWLDSISKTMQTLFTFRPDALPPDVARQLRSGILQALAKSWEEFMRSPQFLEGMKQWMDNAVTFRKMSNDFMASVRNEMQATFRADIDTIMLTVRHMEKRILDQVEDLSAQVADLRQRLGASPPQRSCGPISEPDATAAPEAAQTATGAHSEALMNSGTSSTNPWLQWQRAAFDETLAAAGRMSHSPMLLEKARRIRKGVIPSEPVYEEDRLKLRHFQGNGKPKYRTPLAFIYALVNRPYILDLKQGRSVVAHFVERCFDTYLVDWGARLNADRHLDLDDYINGYMVNVMDFLRERTGVDKVNVLGYCMGGTMSAMFAALHPDGVKNLMLLAAAIGFSSSDGLLNVWTRPEYFDVDQFVGAFGNCPPQFLQSIFLLLRPVGNLIEKPINFYEHMHEEKVLNDFLTTESWLNDNIPVPGEVYRQFVKYLYQQNLLTQNRMPVGRHIVNLKHITCPVLNIMAGQGGLVPCSQGTPFTDLVGSKDRKTILLQGSGHVGLAIGGRAQHEVWPQACDWLAKHTN